MPAPRVLIVDDDPTNRSVLEAFLGPTGVALTSVANGLEAVEAYKDQPFDVVLMDVQMPVMDGLTAIRQIRAWEVAAPLPRARIHVLSAHGFPQDIEASLQAGADSHLTKPLNLPAVVATVFAAAAPVAPLRRHGGDG